MLIRIACFVIIATLAACSALRQVPGRPGETAGFSQVGLASWYGAAHDGLRTASGEAFDPRGLTAAHRTLPFGTVVRVTNLETDRTVKVRINDRGPYAGGRVIDLSQAAAQALGMASDGVAKVRLEVVAADQQES